MTFWSGDKLSDILEPAGIITPFDPDKIDCSSYTLSMGGQFFITPDHDVKSRDSTKKTLQEPVQVQGPPRQLYDGGVLAIPPGQFAFLLSEEQLSIPYNVMGLISMKAGVKLKGLINVSGFHVDPGFKGRLIFSVFNAGPSTIHISRGTPLFLIWFADLDNKATQKYAYPKGPQIEISDRFINDINYPINSTQDIEQRLKKLENWKNLVIGVMAILVTVASLFFAATRFLDKA